MNLIWLWMLVIQHFFFHVVKSTFGIKWKSLASKVHSTMWKEKRKIKPMVIFLVHFLLDNWWGRLIWPLEERKNDKKRIRLVTFIIKWPYTNTMTPNRRGSRPFASTIKVLNQEVDDQNYLLALLDQKKEGQNNQQLAQNVDKKIWNQ